MPGESDGRLRRERDFHDAQARRRRETFAVDPGRLRFADEDYLGHETWIRPAMARLGPVAGRDVLDLGCGHGMASVVLVRAGARVTAVELSGEYLAEARLRASANGVAVRFGRADGDRLPFAAGSFDAVWAHAVLHHLDVPTAARELRRVLRPGGIAVVCEPWDGNPFLRLARGGLPRVGKDRTEQERPLGPRDFAELRRVFPAARLDGFQLLSAVNGLIGPGRIAGCLSAADRAVLGRVPGLRRWCRYVVLTLPATAYTNG